MLKTAFLPLAILAALSFGDGFLGVYLDDNDGPVVTSVIPDSAAQKADIRVGDKFQSVDGKETPTLDVFLDVMQKYDAGAEVDFVLMRSGKKLEKTVTLGKRPDSLPEPVEVEAVPPPEHVEAEGTAPAKSKGKAGGEPVVADPSRRGGAIAVAPSVGGDRAYLGVQISEGGEEGVRFSEVVPDGPAAAAGVKAGDVLMSLGRQENIHSIEDLMGALSKMKPGQTVRAKVSRGGETETLSITLGVRPTAENEAGEEGGEHAEEQKAEKPAARPAKQVAEAEKRAAAAAKDAEKQAAKAQRDAEKKMAEAKAHADAAAKDAAPEADRGRVRAERLTRATEPVENNERDVARLRDEVRGLRDEIRELKDLVRKLSEKK